MAGPGIPENLRSGDKVKVSIEADNVGIGGGTQYTEGDSDATITGNAFLGEDSDTLTPVTVDSSGHLQVDVLTGGGGGTQYTEADTDATITGTALMMEDAADTLRAATGDTTNGLDVDVTRVSGTVTVDGSGVTQPVSGTVTANLSATDNTVLDNIDTNTSGILADTAAIQTAVEIIDNAISGSEMQVDIVSDGAGLATSANQLPDGHNVTIDNASGASAVNIQDGGNTITVDGTVAATQSGTWTLGANTGVDIGDVDVTSVVPGTGASNLGKAEDSAHTTGDVGVMLLGVRHDDTPDDHAATDGDYVPLLMNGGSVAVKTFGLFGNDGSNLFDTSGGNRGVRVTGNTSNGSADAQGPVKIGGRAQTPWAQPDEQADNDRVDGLFDRNGYQRVRGDFDPKYADINDSTSGNNTIIAAAGAGKRIAVWSVMVVSDGTVDVRFEDGAGGTAFTGQIPLQAREGFTYSAGGIVPLWVGAANTLLNLELSAAINVHGHVSYSIIDD